MERVSAPPSPDTASRRAAIERANTIRSLRTKGTSRTPQERDRLLDLLAEEILNQ